MPPQRCAAGRARLAPHPQLDSSDEDDDIALTDGAAEIIGNAVAPEGFTIIEEQPALNSELERNELIGKCVLYAHDSQGATGLFVGTVHSRAT